MALLVKHGADIHAITKVFAVDLNWKTDYRTYQQVSDL
jgi:hypothetical protein